MGQRLVPKLLCLLTLLSLSCDDVPAPKAAAANGKIVSLSPAATDLLVQMGLKDRIVGVSPWDADPDLKLRLPKVGDYERVDWEKLAELKPQFLIQQGRPDRLPPGLADRCREMNVTLVNIQIDKIADIDIAIARLGEALDAPDAAKKLIDRMHASLEAVRSKRATPTPALIVLSENGKFVAGRDNYLDDLLTLTGANNVITSSGYPTIDQEMLLTLKPEVIFVLMPSATDASVQQAIASINSATELPAVKNGRVYPITTPDALLPATGTLHLARTFSGKLTAAGQATP